LRRYSDLVRRISKPLGISTRSTPCAIAWLPEAAGSFLFRILVEEIEELKRRGAVSLKKPTEQTLARLVDRQREIRQERASEAYRLLGLPDPVANHAKRTTIRKEQEIALKDRASLSTTFSKSSARTLVQGGSSGLKRCDVGNCQHRSSRQFVSPRNN
jgi:hypothetical protein